MVPIVITSSPTISTPIPTENPTIASTSGETETDGQIRPAETRSPMASPNQPYPSPSSPSPTCPKCIIHPDDTEKDECPIATTGTCSNGNRGDGICPFKGYCCSKWGYCGTTDDYCDDDSVAPTPSGVEGAPTAPPILLMLASVLLATSVTASAPASPIVAVTGDIVELAKATALPRGFMMKIVANQKMEPVVVEVSAMAYAILDYA
eukprot:CAMPEP_0183762154 /NCGR_PEP_ID=MMETSP0739-20130205/8898_1 /TAXON_ID=385413 /ORGANISM="Thalassiosira miniscula, Strain CCMP1093" /LENGTH=206 /DNA_ID=CAMNT_0026000409 /DNA_START=57 /DNA_END=674 /DNA_ORIENTATION=+